ncbi:MAG: hypothetical protein ACRD0A_02650 [Acidimicrobiales bacterium]
MLNHYVERLGHVVPVPQEGRRRDEAWTVVGNLGMGDKIRIGDWLLKFERGELPADADEFRRLIDYDTFARYTEYYLYEVAQLW